MAKTKVTLPDAAQLEALGRLALAARNNFQNQQRVIARIIAICELPVEIVVDLKTLANDAARQEREFWPEPLR